ncbi:hypothetical protein, partial [Bacteroides sp.]
ECEIMLLPSFFIPPPHTGNPLSVGIRGRKGYFREQPNTGIVKVRTFRVEKYVLLPHKGTYLYHLKVRTFAN